MRSIPGIVTLTLLAGLAPVASAQLLAPLDQPSDVVTPLLGHAEISFDRMAHDFGEILDDANVETTFTFTNTGDTTLEILDHRATCGCTVPEISKRSLLPGESAALKVVFHPAHKRGQQHQTVTLMTNAADQPQVVLTINANVRQTTWADPAVAHFSRIEKGDDRELTVDVYSRVPGFKVESATFVESAAIRNAIPFEASVGEVSEVPGDSEGEVFRKYTITIRLSPTVAIGNHTETISIKTNDPRKPIIQQQVIAEVIGDLIPNPNRVSLGVVRPGDAMRAEFKITSRAMRPFKILKAEVSPVGGADLQVQVEPVAEGGAPDIKITLFGTAPTTVQPIRGKIELTTNSKDQPKIEVPFYATVRGTSR